MENPKKERKSFVIDRYAEQVYVSLLLAAGSLFLLGEYTQFEKGHALYMRVKELLGENPAIFMLGQLSDLAGPICLTAGIGLTVEYVCSLIETFVSKKTNFTIEKSTHKQVVFLCFILLTLWTTHGVVSREWEKMVDSSFDESRCGHPGPHCRGEIEDVLAESVPIVAAGVYGIQLGVQATRKRKKRKDSRV